MTELPTEHHSMTTLKSSPANFTQCLLTPPPGLSPKVGIAILSLAFIVGFSGNAFIIWTILFRMKKRTVTCILIFHLAVADIMVILTAPFFLHLLSTGSWTSGNAICKLCHYIGCLSMYASIFLITFMSVDRFLAVAKPFSFQKLRTKPVIRMLVFAIWVLSFLLAIPMLIYRIVIPIRGMQICYPCHSNFQQLILQYLFEIIIGFVIPFTVIVYCYAYIGIRLRSAKFQSKQKTSRLVVLIVVTFSLFLIPYQVVNILQVSGNLITGPTGEKLKQAAAFARPIVTALIFLSSSINPILYGFAGGTFIRTAGIGFMAKLFEGTSSEVSSLRKVSQVFRQRSRNESVEMGKRGEEIKTLSLNQ